MSIRDFISSITDHRRIFAFLIALSIALCSTYIKMTESYTAEIIIKYICDSADQGLTENGKKINPDEINSPYVVKNAMSVLGLQIKNTETVCRNITVTPIVPTPEKEKYASWIDKFSDYEETEDDKKFTVYYSVKYTSSTSQNNAERILSAIISQYRLYYVEKYIYSSDITRLSGEAALQYDYYETVDMLREKIKSNINYLSKISEAEYDYRSPRTGYSLLDLATEYKSLSERDLSVAERMIIENGMSKNAGYLRNSLQNKATKAEYDIELNNKKAETQKNLMTVYSEKNKQYLWDDDRNENEDSESSQVRGDVERDKVYSQTKSVYDNLILDYVRYRKSSLNADIDKQRYENDINSFPDGFSNTKLQKELEKNLTGTCERFNNLYTLTKSTINDYNAYKSAKSIESTSGVVSHKSANTVFSYTVSLIIALMLGVVLSVLLAYIEKKDDDGE